MNKQLIKEYLTAKGWMYERQKLYYAEQEGSVVCYTLSEQDYADTTGAIELFDLIAWVYSKQGEVKQ